VINKLGKVSISF